ncbi:MAG TPA: SPOR domain-containing protein [Bacteroidetes bacterium]|nr:SPOR domain-containing protein [Bacteroidota bacterium]
MSRLDYITIGIVAACILAIVFLVYKMTDLFDDQPADDTIENTSGEVEEESGDVYDYNVDSVETAGEAATDSVAAPEESTEEGATAAESGEEVRFTPDPATATPVRKRGKFMVIAGTFSQKDNAKKQLRQLKKLGYTNASVEIFDRGKYAVVLVDRFNNMAAAERLVKDLRAEGISSYVKVKERR